VVNEGKHLTADQYKLERDKAKGNGAGQSSATTQSLSPTIN